MSTLVYLGCHEGYSLKNILNNYNFDKILLVEADPNTFNRLLDYTKNKNNIIAINKCLVSDKNIKKTIFYRTINDGASNSIHKPNVGNDFIKEELELDCVYLPDLLEEYKIDDIDLYISDIQGNDFSIICTILDRIQNKKIKELFLETFNDNYSFYNINNNNFKNYYKILSDNYKVDYMSADSTILKSYEEITQFFMNDGHGELDVHWSLKSNNMKYYLV